MVKSVLWHGKECTMAWNKTYIKGDKFTIAVLLSLLPVVAKFTHKFTVNLIPT